MKKRVISVVLMTVLCLSLSATAFAADSAEEDNSTTQNKTVSVEEAKVDADMLNSLEEAQKATLSASVAFKDVDLTNDTANAAASDKFIREEMKADLTNSKVVASKMVNLTMPEGASSVTYTIHVPGVKASHSVIMYHLKDDGNWESIKATAGDGTITATFTSLSPVVYMVVERTTVDQQQPQQPAEQPQQPAPQQPQQSQTQQTTPTAANDPAKSPNTGAGSNAVLLAMFVMALGGAAWYGKKCFGNAR